MNNDRRQALADVASEMPILIDRPAAPATEHPNDPVARAWALLKAVPDPEIPVLSVVDLGIIRRVDATAEQVTVDITPTYSACPATAVIERNIEASLATGFAQVAVNVLLSPPWTTDWISADGRAKLQAYGIAPPQAAGSPTCPHCGSETTERIAEFGSTPCKALWRCADCREPFDYFKCF